MVACHTVKSQTYLENYNKQFNPTISSVLHSERSTLNVAAGRKGVRRFRERKKPEHRRPGEKAGSVLDQLNSDGLYAKHSLIHYESESEDEEEMIECEPFSINDILLSKQDEDLAVMPTIKPLEILHEIQDDVNTDPIK